MVAAVIGSQGLGRDSGSTPVGLRVLVVDSHVDCADSLQLLLSLQGHDVRQARNGHEALAVAAAFRPQVALVELVLPGIDGFALAPRLRAIEGCADLVLAANTCLGSRAHRVRACQAGFDVFWLKPLDPDTLLRALATLPLGRPIR